MGTMPLGEAIQLVSDAGLTCRIMVGLVGRNRSIRVALDTTDPDPQIAFSIDAAREEFLDTRQQSGPERWDYVVQEPEHIDRWFLRIESGGCVADVPLLPAMLSIILAHGWTDDTRLTTEARVDATAIRAAVSGSTVR
jgi:hypothetical protein